MGKLIVSEFVSVDGVMEAPGGEPGYAHSGWVAALLDEEWLAYKLSEVREAEAHLLGRVTYESFAAAWPSREGEFAEKINAMPKYVASTTRDRFEWTNSWALKGDVVAAVTSLKQKAGGPLLVAGSRTLVHTLYAHDLVDEYRLMVFPVVLGSGRRLFPDNAPAKRALKLVDTRVFASGVAVHTYHPA